MRYNPRDPLRWLPFVLMSLDELLEKCAQTGDTAAWEEFVRRFHGLIAAVVLRTTKRWGSTSPALVDDLIQEIYVKICGDRKRLLSEFTPHHPQSFYGYLKVIAANVVHDYFRSQHSYKRGSAQTEASIDEYGARMPMATRNSPESVHRDILLKEVDEVLRSNISGDEQRRDRTIFWLYYRYGLAAPAIARLPSISLTVKGVESVIHRLTRTVREHLAGRKAL
jgi:RNA polymerase sigma-70 factor (ECF subfamily)